VAVHLADEGVDVDHQPPAAGAGTRRPGALERFGEHAIELAHVPKRKRAQKRPQRRRGRDPMAEQPAGPPRAQDVAVVDRVGAQQHRRDQRHRLRARVRGPDPRPEAHEAINQRLDPQPRRQHRGQRNPGVGDRPPVIEGHLHSIQSDRPVILHHESDLLTQDAAARHDRFSPAQEVISLPRPDRPTQPKRWIEAKGLYR
jgi:hypothetical protein